MHFLYVSSHDNSKLIKAATKYIRIMLTSVPQTIMDSSRVLVMEAGQVKEFDSPASLLANHQSAFYKMAKDAGLVTSEQHRI